MNNLNIDIYADGANLEHILELYDNPIVKGFTTNPTLMRKDGVEDYVAFSKNLLSHINDRPISFEVFADDEENIYRQAMIISEWADNVNVKIPVINTKGESLVTVINKLSNQGVKINVTAVFTSDQVKSIMDNINHNNDAIISVFAGRIADAGFDPIQAMKSAKSLIVNAPKIKLLWASPRQIYNVYDAIEGQADIITMSSDLISKIKGFGKDLTEFSQETVQMFYNDAVSAGYKI